jgi:hypothetical protein
MFVDSRIRFAYLPRNNSSKSDRLYSGRNQSLSSDLAFFINLSLNFFAQAPCGKSEANTLARYGWKQLSLFRPCAHVLLHPFSDVADVVKRSVREWKRSLVDEFAIAWPLVCP